MRNTMVYLLMCIFITFQHSGSMMVPSEIENLPNFYQNPEERQNANNYEGKVLVLPELPQCQLHIAESKFDPYSNYNSLNLQFGFEINCDSRPLCLLAYIDRDDQVYVDSLSGIPNDCPSGKILLRLAEKVGRQIGSERIVLEDESYFIVFNKFSLRSSMLKTLLSIVKPEKLGSYYSDRGYSYLSPGEGDEAAQTVWSLNKLELFESLRKRDSSKSVRKVIEKYGLAPEDNVGALFRHLYYSQSEEMQADCGILIDNLYGHSSGMESIKNGNVRKSFKGINGIHNMFKDLQ